MGMKRTSKGNFGGGDSAWEEEKMLSYATSEVRLTEIQEQLCNDIKKAQSQCRTLAEEHESLIEDWWSLQKSSPDLHSWLCIEQLKVCCPDLHYGANCEPCPGYPDQICNNNGNCKGAGSRKGNGKCACNKGYEGDLCDKCTSDYYESYRDDTKFLCSKCYKACDGSCRQGGPKGCVKCRSGWFMHTELGCVDIDECGASVSPCRSNQLCVNNEGNYECMQCDPTCNECHGQGPDMCVACAKGYTKRRNVCVANRWFLDGYLEPTTVRYVTYGGLCIATCIVLQKSLLLASVVGVTVAAYIAVSEYFIGGDSEGIL